MKKTIGLIGGDLRQRYLADVLQMPVVFFANESINEKETVVKGNYLSDLFLESDIIIVPIPFSRDQEHVYTKYFVDCILIDAFIESLTKDNTLIGGPFSKDVIRRIHEKGAKLIDITAFDSFKFKNAVPTAEGVLAEIIHKIKSTIHGSRALILGYGYCGKRLANTLNELGAEIVIYTENPDEEREIKSKGYDLIHHFDNNKSYDYIINTIPKIIMSTEDIINETELFIDITEAYQMSHDCFVKMRGIPGRFSPKTAGVIIGEILNDLIKSIMGEQDKWN